ncbi:alpha/beta fold hydrolase [Massilia terrae]|uniref:Alpha/beta fold hydrolase n=1 Tax=Massilia terrae TaxID=1811224 RepID=A0ABT2CTK6_9BURK|nr:alpha/beta fold hydrolase [Massilia terrae]MCS0657313.1 alpha/beta fold hydrolase [Massilia terrae]
MIVNLLLFLVGAVMLLAAAGALFTWRTARRIEAHLPPQGRFIDVPGARLHIVEAGSGPALLLVHGLGGQLCHYTYNVVERLAASYRVIAVDRPGSGYSTRDPSASAGLPAQAAALSSLVAALGLERPLVVGHSLGGALALQLALDHPQRVGGLALVAPLTHAPDAVPAAFEGLTIASPTMRKLVAWTLATPAAIMRATTVLAQVFGPEPVPRDFATRGGGLLSLRPGQFLASSADLQALPAAMEQLERRYGELRVPVRILFGKDDRILDWRANGQALADKAPGAALTLVDGGHMLPITQPPLTAAFIREAAGQQFGLAGRQATG